MGQPCRYNQPPAGGGGGGSSFDPASPGPIGGTTPAFATFTGVAVGAADVVLDRGGAGILEQRNGTNGQAFRVYNTYTDASNYERAGLAWNTNRFELSVDYSGTGALREFWIIPADPITGTRFKFGNGIISAFYAGTIDERCSIILNGALGLVADGGAAVQVSSLNTSMTGAAILEMNTNSNTVTTQIIRCNRKNAGGGYTGPGHHLSIYAGQSATSGVGGAGGNLLLAGGAAADVGGAAFNGGDLFLDGGAGINAGVAGRVVFNSVTAGGAQFNRYADLVEMTAPAAPAANTGRIYCQDNGAGKTQLMVRFATGAAQQIAIEP